MSMHRPGPALGFLERRASLVTGRERLPTVRDVLIIGGTTSPLLGALVRLMFGYDVSVRSAASVGAALDALNLRAPDLVFVEQVLPPAMPAVDILPLARRCGYTGPLVVLATSASPGLVRALLDAGAADVVDRDELDSARIAEVLLRAFGAEDPLATELAS
jgi:DNA-binding NarL/FixJ family response regulator